MPLALDGEEDCTLEDEADSNNDEVTDGALEGEAEGKIEGCFDGCFVGASDLNQFTTGALDGY